MTNRNPFTLVELLTTITILAVLAGIALGVTKLVFTKAHESKNRAVIKMIEIALEQYKTKYGYYNNMWQFFDENFKNSHTKTGQVYVKLTDGTGKQMTCTYVIDAKGNPLIYRCPGLFNTSSFDLGSAGEDGCLGDGGTPINSNMKIEDISKNEEDYKKFGQGDDIVNFTNNLQ